jgi:hypothetical protein
MGKVDQSQEALAMLEYLRLRRITSVVTSQDVKGDFPDLRYPPGFEVIAGLLLVPLSVGGNDFIGMYSELIFFQLVSTHEERIIGGFLVA